ncbi:MAG: hypothetical protein JJT78_14295 [Leptospira sp.]|nr:hypothetical protein [Leptospira sp.]
MSFYRIFILHKVILTALMTNAMYCTNYSSTKAESAPPIIISVVAVDTNRYTLTARAQNPEIIFGGYRIYPGISERDSRNPGDLNNGIDCFGGVAQIPNQPFEYIYQITPDAGGPTDNAICRFVADLNPGTFVTIRSLLNSLTVSNGLLSLDPSGPSNTIVLPAFVPSADPDTQSSE